MADDHKGEMSRGEVSCVDPTVVAVAGVDIAAADAAAAATAIRRSPGPPVPQRRVTHGEGGVCGTRARSADRGPHRDDDDRDGRSEPPPLTILGWLNCASLFVVELSSRGVTVGSEERLRCRSAVSGALDAVARRTRLDALAQLEVCLGARRQELASVPVLAPART
ncbi:hypothetical protein MTO96_019146 [Rhipicephalus appendiculatus]